MKASIAHRILIAGALVGAALGSTVSHAAGAPTLVTTSVEGGFSGQGPIAARFDKTLDAAMSVGSLRDKNDAEVASTTVRTSSGMGPTGDSLVLTPSYTALRETLSPYTVTFTAFEAVGSGTPGSIAISRTFVYDLERPEVAITSPASSAAPTVVAPGESLELGGYAFDRTAYDIVDGAQVARTANRSGLDRVEVQYYALNPTMRPPTVTPGAPPTVTTEPPSVTPGTPPTVGAPVLQPSQEVGALRHNAALSDCSRGTGCVDGEKTWTANTAGLTPGSWTAKVVSVDAAGNRSAIWESNFVILG